MPNPLTRVNDAIKQDPHGEVARQASHWLAVDVMGWEEKYLGCLLGFCYVDLDNKDIEINIADWQPLTDANSAWELVKHCKQTPMIIRQHVYEVGINKLFECYTGGDLTDDTMKGWLGNE